MKNRNVVKQNTKLIHSKYKLNPSEMKFVLCALAQIKMEDTDFNLYSIDINILEQKMQAEQNETRLKSFAKKLMSKPFEVQTERGWAVFNWFSKLEYIRGEKRFEVRIDDHLKPYLLELKANFTQVNLKYILPLDSQYSIRIYQLLKDREKLTRWLVSVDELQEILQVPKSMKRYDNFKRKVLQVAEKELIENCDIFFEIEEIKSGRKVTEILFRIKNNKPFLEEKSPKLFDLDSEYSDYIGKEVVTTNGVQTIKLITPYKDFFSVDFEDGGNAKIKSLKDLTYE
jgi:plasmid replication initiation protein